MDSLTDKAYSLYPKGLDFFSDQDEYLQSKEFINLIKQIDSHRLSGRLCEESNLWHILNKWREIIDNTCFEWWDRAYNWQIVLKSHDDKKFRTTIILCLNLSIVSNLYTFYLLQTKFNKIENKLENAPHKITMVTDSFLDEISSLHNLVRSNSNKEYINIEELDQIVPDLSFRDIPLGNLNHFNAFFLNDTYTKIW